VLTKQLGDALSRGQLAGVVVTPSLQPGSSCWWELLLAQRACSMHLTAGELGQPVHSTPYVRRTYVRRDVPTSPETSLCALFKFGQNALHHVAHLDQSSSGISARHALCWQDTVQPPLFEYETLLVGTHFNLRPIRTSKKGTRTAALPHAAK
jgi:hypothetical protein